MPKVTINGKSRAYPDGRLPATLEELVRDLGLDPRALVAEVDGATTSSGAFQACPIRDGSRVELVQFVGGG
ncbi:MAG: sulfur carrier protein ThiS [Planctomycetota bacterium]